MTKPQMRKAIKEKIENAEYRKWQLDNDFKEEHKVNTLKSSFSISSNNIELGDIIDYRYKTIEIAQEIKTLKECLSLFDKEMK